MTVFTVSRAGAVGGFSGASDRGCKRKWEKYLTLVRVSVEDGGESRCAAAPVREFAASLNAAAAQVVRK